MTLQHFITLYARRGPTGWEHPGPGYVVGIEPQSGSLKPRSCFQSHPFRSQRTLFVRTDRCAFQHTSVSFEPQRGSRKGGRRNWPGTLTSHRPGPLCCRSFPAFLLKSPILVLAALLFFCSQAPGARKTDMQRTVEHNGVRVRMEGASDTPWKSLRPVIELQLSLGKDTTATPPLADDMAFFVQKEYRRLGYRSAMVDWNIVGGEAVLTAVEGEREKIGVITVDGTDELTKEELHDYLLRPTKERLGKLGNDVPVVEQEIEDGTGLVQRLLQSKGYLSAIVDPPFFVKATAGRTDIRLTVHEGPRSLFGEVTIRGELPPKPDEILKEAAERRGQPFSEVKVEELRGKLTTAAQSTGHFKAKVVSTFQPRPRGGEIPVTLDITLGPLYTVSGIEISPDLSRGTRRVVEAGFRPATGDVWSTSDLDLMQRRVMDTGVLTRLDVVPVPSPGGEPTLTLRISGSEGPRRTLGIFGGYETLKGSILGTEWRHVNIWNTGDTLRLKAAYEAGFEGSIRWIDPAIFNSPYALDTELSAQTISLYDYTHNSLKLRSTLSRQFTRRFAASAYFLISADTATSSSLTDEELGPDAYNTMALGGTVSLDFRDNPLLPHRGWMTSFGFEAGMADINYLRTDFRASYYHPFSKKFRVAANVQASAISAPDGVDKLPIDTRLFNGGASTVRSFAEKELGPLSHGRTPLGGTFMNAANLEFSYEIIDNLEIAVFADAGSLSRTDDNLFAFPGDLRYAVGLGFRYALPVGPLRVDYGFNPSPRGGEASGALHVTFGFAF
jgi:outer membrane protein insertion porin family